MSLREKLKASDFPREIAMSDFRPQMKLLAEGGWTTPLLLGVRKVGHMLHRIAILT
jgi:hypothetical protein